MGALKDMLQEPSLVSSVACAGEEGAMRWLWDAGGMASQRAGVSVRAGVSSTKLHRSGGGFRWGSNCASLTTVMPANEREG